MIHGTNFGRLLNRERDPWTSPNICHLLETFQSVSSDEWQIVDEHGNLHPPLACSFAQVSSSRHILAVADEIGYLTFYNTNVSGPNAIVKEFEAHNNAIFDVAWMEMEFKIVTGSGDQSAALWDVNTSQKLEVFKGHTSSIRSVAFRHSDDAVLATGSRDGHIMVWDKRCQKKDGRVPPVNEIHNAHAFIGRPASGKKRRKSKLGQVMDCQQSVTSVVWQTENHLVSAGAVDGCIKVWDLRKTYSAVNNDPIPVTTFPYAGHSQKKHGFSSMTLDSYKSRLFASCTDDVIYMYDLITCSKSPLCVFRGHQNSEFYVRVSVSPNNDFLLSGSGDEMGYIWQIDKPSCSPVVLKCHSAEVTCVSWNPDDFTKVVTCSDDSTMRIWRMNRNELKAENGERIGKAERTRREIGTSTITPQKLVMTGEDRKCTPNRSSPSFVQSPSIKDWFNTRWRMQERSPTIATVTGTRLPRHSPKNSEQKENLCSPKKTSKRKLDIEEAVYSPMKRQCLAEMTPTKGEGHHQTALKNLNLHYNCVEVTQNVACVKPCVRSNSSGDCLSNMKNDCVEKAKEFGIHSTRSPTLGLPNLVVDEARGTPFRAIAELRTPKKNPGVDWLTQMRLYKQSPGQSSQSSAEELTSKSEISSPSRVLTPIKGMKSIASYFKPPSAKKSQNK
ncbi:denticleless protein homolog [Gigantopelta aegis]|uniref:denticleless protein homolog n=1 Tax=Gigantopelta aegis TaxID=1735272 RepID=UPI001B888B58|nr:denticleless protein homolog [Gigantopelta aegis]